MDLINNKACNIIDEWQSFNGNWPLYNRNATLTALCTNFADFTLIGGRLPSNTSSPLAVVEMIFPDEEERCFLFTTRNPATRGGEMLSLPKGSYKLSNRLEKSIPVRCLGLTNSLASFGGVKAFCIQSVSNVGKSEIGKYSSNTINDHVNNSGFYFMEDVYGFCYCGNNLKKLVVVEKMAAMTGIKINDVRKYCATHHDRKKTTIASLRKNKDEK